MTADLPEPVMLEIVRLCHFKQKPCALCGKAKANAIHQKTKTEPAACPFQRQLRCEHCGRNKSDPAHFGAPVSYNAIGGGRGAGAGAMVAAGMKQSWQAIFTTLLRESGLPLGLDRVFVEGEITFPDHREDRDQGNFRVVIEKALGDALEQGGWLVNDNWDRYEFGGLAKREQQGVSATRLMIFPGAPKRALTDFDPHPGQQLEIA